jgi:predicted nucleic acid-binding protein
LTEFRVGARSALDSFADIPVRLAEIDLAESVELAEEHGIYAYDAYVLVCARRYAAPLLTLDRPQRGVALRMGLDVLEIEG